jgi:hypothetical protein
MIRFVGWVFIKVYALAQPSKKFERLKGGLENPPYGSMR